MKIFAIALSATLLAWPHAAVAQVKVLMSGGFSAAYEQLLPEFTGDNQTSGEPAHERMDADPFPGRAGDERENNKYQHRVQGKLSFIDALRPSFQHATDFQHDEDIQCATTNAYGFVDLQQFSLRRI